MNGSIAIVGLGSGSADQLTLGVWERLRKAGRLYLRTSRHPVVSLLEEHGLAYESFDPIYEASESFDAVYQTIVRQLIEHSAASPGEEIVYAVPGHPMVAERTVGLLREQAMERGIRVGLYGGESFLDQAFLRFGFDPIDGFQLLDAQELQHERIVPGTHLLIGQVYDAFTASDVKLALMEHYPEDYVVHIGRSLGVKGEEEIKAVPLLELDRQREYGNLVLVWVPASTDDRVRWRSFARLREIVAILRSPDGCPWDREQTHASIRNNLIEETYEVLETIDDDDPTAMCEELGDLLLQIMLHAQMEDETGAFNVYDIIEGLNKKLIRRHPHVFGEQRAGNADEALVSWNRIKEEEKKLKGETDRSESVLSGVPRELPALMKAWKLQKKAAQVGFDWDSLQDVMGKVKEELAELEEAIADGSGDQQLEELGDLLFAAVNLSRFLKADPEEALSLTNRKFTRRFAYIEEQLRINGRTFGQTNLLEMENWWQEAKGAIRSASVDEKKL